MTRTLEPTLPHTPPKGESIEDILRRRLDEATEQIRSLQRDAKELDKLVPLIASVRTEFREPLQGVDAWSVSVPHNGHRGGDLCHFIDYAHDFGLERMINRVEAREQPTVASKLREHRRQISWAMLDVTGKRSTDGLLAALYLRDITRGIASYLEHRGYVPPEMLEIVNHLAYHGEKSAVKMTAFSFGDVRAQPGENSATVRLVSAGMPTPVVFRASSGDIDNELYQRWREAGNFPLGLMPSAEYRDAGRTQEESKPPYNVMKTRLQPGDRLILGSDGLFEYGSIDHTDKAQALKRMIQIMRDNPQARAHELGGQIFDEFLYNMRNEAHDDMTLAIVQYKGKNS